MYPAAGQFPHQPGVHSAEQDLAARSFFARFLNMVEDPLDLGAGKIGIRDQAGGLPDVVAQPLSYQVIHNACRTAALPDDGIVDRAAGVALPQDSRLALVGDADASHLGRGYACRCEHFEHGGVLGRPDVHRILFHPALMRIMLRQLVLPDRKDILLVVEQDRARAGRALVQGEDIFCHDDLPPPVLLISCPYHTLSGKGLSISPPDGRNPLQHGAKYDMITSKYGVLCFMHKL